MDPNNPTSVAQDLLTQLKDAWNAADGTRYGAVFADDGDFVTIRGEHVSGAHAIGAGHQQIFESIYRGSTTTLELDEARQVAPGAVVAVASWVMDAPAGPLQGRHCSRMSLTITFSDDGWRIAAAHNTLMPEPA